MSCSSTRILTPITRSCKAIRGKPYYVPDKKEFLAYDNPFYWESTPEATAFPKLSPDQTTIAEDMIGSCVSQTSIMVSTA
jgi:hypothetical protein